MLKNQTVLKIATLTFALVFAALPLRAGRTDQQGFERIDLVADTEGQALDTDANLLNAWGLVVEPDGKLIVADNHSDSATFYEPSGKTRRMRLVVDSAPTGMVMNHSPKDFMIPDGRHLRPSRFLFASGEGTILAWGPELKDFDAVIVADNSASSAVYKGLALGRTREGDFLYAADFHNDKVDVYDSDFHWVKSFTDEHVDAGFAPFNVRNIGGVLLVTFAKQHGPDNEDDEAGPGNGFVDVFDLQGHLVRMLAAHGALDSPWGLALAPRDFGPFGGALLVGNFGDGRINAFNPLTGEFLGSCNDADGKSIQIEGLWSLSFRGDAEGDHHEGGDDGSNALYFTAGPGGESHGALGILVQAGRHPHH